MEKLSSLKRNNKKSLNSPGLRHVNQIVQNQIIFRGSLTQTGLHVLTHALMFGWNYDHDDDDSAIIIDLFRSKESGNLVERNVTQYQSVAADANCRRKSGGGSGSSGSNKSEQLKRSVSTSSKLTLSQTTQAKLLVSLQPTNTTNT